MEGDSFWDWEGFHFQYRHCNIVFTPDKLKAFLRKHCSLPSKAVQDLAGYSTPIETLAFDAGCVVVKPNPPLRLFNLAALPSELILLVMKLLFNQTKSRSNIDDLKSLSNTSKRFRALSTPLLFSRLSLKPYGTETGASNNMQKFLNDPIPRPILKHFNSLILVFRLNSRPPEETQRSWYEIVPRFLSYCLEERQKQNASCAKLWLTLNDSAPDNRDPSNQRKDVQQIAGCISSGLSTLSELKLKAGRMDVQQFLPQFSEGLKSLFLATSGSAAALDCLTLPLLQRLVLNAPSPGFSIHQYHCLDNLVIIPTFFGDGLSYWTFADLEKFLSACPSTLRLLHLGMNFIQSEETTSLDHRGSSDNAIIPQTVAIPFKKLAILRLASIHTKETEQAGDDDLAVQPLGPMFSDLFSLAPIRRLYFKDNNILELRRSRSLDNDMSSEVPSTDVNVGSSNNSFWDGLVNHRVRKRSGWKQLESIVHDGFSNRDGEKENSGLLESDGVVLENDPDWWVEW